MEADTVWTPEDEEDDEDEEDEEDEEDDAKVNGVNIKIRYKCDKPGCPPFRSDFFRNRHKSW